MLWNYYRDHCGINSPPQECAAQFIRFSLATASFTLVMIYSVLEYWDYKSERTGTNIAWPEVAEIPYPAVSICDMHFNITQMDVDLGGIGHIVEVDEDGSADDVTKLYRVADALNRNVSEMLWKYFFTLDKILIPRAINSSGVLATCRVGGVSCEVPAPNASAPDLMDAYATPQVSVPAGIWTSRFMADSDVGKTLLCHTLLPNVTVNFSRDIGDSINMEWNPVYRRYTDYWRVFVHDRNELVTLTTYGKLPPANIVVLRTDEDADGFSSSLNTTLCKQRTMIVPHHKQLLRNSDLSPCNATPGYSKSQCDIEWGWARRIDRMRQAYNANATRFVCVPPGILTNESYRMPVCNHTTETSSPNGTLGLLNLLLPQFAPANFSRDDEHPVMTRPPVCTDLGTLASSGCHDLCDTVSYTLQSEVLCDQRLSNIDMELYFATPIIETQTDFLVVGALDFTSNIGGGLGLLMGLSFLELAYIFLDLCLRLANWCASVSQKKEKQSKVDRILVASVADEMADGRARAPINIYTPSERASAASSINFQL